MIELSTGQTIDCLLSASNKLCEHYFEYKTGIYDWENIMPGLFKIIKDNGITPNILDVIRVVCDSDMHYENKILMLEAVSCDLSFIAKDMGILK